MKYLVTLQDNRKFDVVANSISQAAVLTVELLARVPAGKAVSIAKPVNLTQWWYGYTQNNTITFKIKPVSWKATRY